MAKPNIQKFNFHELFSNNTGKTSASALCGIMTNIVGLACFAFGCYTKNATIIDNSLLVITTGAALLGVRKFFTKSDILKTSDEDKSDDKPEDKKVDNPDQ